jgi:hypothetical protein
MRQFAHKRGYTILSGLCILCVALEDNYDGKESMAVD